MSPLATPPGQQCQGGWSLGGGPSTISFTAKPWMFGQARLPNPLADRKRKNKQSEPTIKQNNPVVILGLFSSGNKNRAVESVKTNLCIKLPQYVSLIFWLKHQIEFQAILHQTNCFFWTPNLYLLPPVTTHHSTLPKPKSTGDTGEYQKENEAKT